MQQRPFVQTVGPQGAAGARQWDSASAICFQAESKVLALALQALHALGPSQLKDCLLPLIPAHPLGSSEGLSFKCRLHPRSDGLGGSLLCSGATTMEFPTRRASPPPMVFWQGLFAKPLRFVPCLGGGLMSALSACLSVRCSVLLSAPVWASAPQGFVVAFAYGGYCCPLQVCFLESSWSCLGTSFSRGKDVRFLNRCHTDAGDGLA